jgi:DNA-binding transcriptional ArsR family regulator
MILNLMVKYQNAAALDRTFSALSDSTRRAILARLGEGSISVSELAKPFPVSLPAIMKHLDVLSDAGLILREKNGRVVACRLQARPMQEAMSWLSYYEKFWSERLERLAAFLEEETCPPHPVLSQVLPSSGASMRGRKKSSRHGRGRSRS